MEILLGIIGTTIFIRVWLSHLGLHKQAEKHHKELVDKLDNTVLGNGWISIGKDKPLAKQRVYVVCENDRGKKLVKYQTMAEYIPYMTVIEDDYMSEEFHGEGDYNEKEDEYYTPEGWYEYQTEPEMSWKISVKITHWMPLIALP